MTFDWYGLYHDREPSPPPTKDELLAPYLERTKAPQGPPECPFPSVRGPLDQFGVSAQMRVVLHAQYGTARPFPTDDGPLQFSQGDVDFAKLSLLHDMVDLNTKTLRPNPWEPTGISDRMLKAIEDSKVERLRKRQKQEQAQ